MMFILLYPYPYQVWTLILTSVLVLGTAVPLYFLSRYLSGRMKLLWRNSLVKIFKCIGFLAIAFLLLESIITVITIHQVNKHLGFRYATPDTPQGELFRLTSLTPGGIMEEAGFMKGDQFYFDSVNELYLLLIKGQGKEVSVPVLRNGEEELINVNIPEMRLPLVNVSFLI